MSSPFPFTIGSWYVLFKNNTTTTTYFTDEKKDESNFRRKKSTKTKYIPVEPRTAHSDKNVYIEDQPYFCWNNPLLGCSIIIIIISQKKKKKKKTHYYLSMKVNKRSTYGKNNRIEALAAEDYALVL